MTQTDFDSAWSTLQDHLEVMQGVQMRDLFEADERRFERFSLRLGDVLFDYSKNRMTDETIEHLVALAEAAGVPELRDAMFSGDKINTTEDRAVLHIALRNRADNPIVVDGEDVMPGVTEVLGKMRTFSEAVRGGSWVGYTR